MTTNERQKRQIRLVREGRCQRCTLPLTSQERHARVRSCEGCRKRLAEYTRAKRERLRAEREELIASGICTTCGLRRVYKGLRSCPECAQANRDAQAGMYERRRHDKHHDDDAALRTGRQERTPDNAERVSGNVPAGD